MDNIKIGFLGYGTRALDALMSDNRFDVKYFLTPKSRLCKDVFDAEEKYRDKLKLEIISNKNELLERVKEINDVECFLMNACPFILTEEILSNMDFYNIHPGSLFNNRGHQPHLWSVLLDERKTSICLHKVNTEIDLGYVIEEIEVELKGNENSLEVLNMTEDKIPLLLTGLYNYITGKADYKYFISEGEYRPIMKHSDYEINKNDNVEDIDRKIRARYMNNGAFFISDNKRIYVDEIISVVPYNKYELKYNNERAVYSFNGNKIEFKVKKITDLEGNILYCR